MKGHFLIGTHLITWECQDHPPPRSRLIAWLWQSNFSDKRCYLTLSWHNICTSSLTWADRFSGGLRVIPRPDSSPARSPSWVCSSAVPQRRSSSAESWRLKRTWISWSLWPLSVSVSHPCHFLSRAMQIQSPVIFDKRRSGLGSIPGLEEMDTKAERSHRVFLFTLKHLDIVL